MTEEKPHSERQARGPLKAEPAGLEPGHIRPPTLLGIPSYLAGNVARTATRTLWNSLAEHGLRLNQHAVLVALHDFGPMAQHEIADRLDVDRSQVVGFVDPLERDGHVIRTRDPRDRRRVLVSITPEGAAVERRVTDAARDIQSVLFASLSAAELAQLVGLLQRVLDDHDAARLGFPQTPSLQQER